MVCKFRSVFRLIDLTSRRLRLFFFSSRRRHTRSKHDWSSDVCSSDLFSIDNSQLFLLVQNLREELLCSGMGRVGEEMLRCAFLDNRSLIHEENAVGDLAGKTHRSEERRVGKECKSQW